MTRKRFIKLLMGHPALMYSKRLAESYTWYVICTNRSKCCNRVHFERYASYEDFWKAFCDHIEARAAERREAEADG